MFLLWERRKDRTEFISAFKDAAKANMELAEGIRTLQRLENANTKVADQLVDLTMKVSALAERIR